MPTYLFYCDDCDEEWSEQQSIKIKREEHTSKCSKCKKICKNKAFGGSGFQFSGRYLNKQLTDFPNYASKINRQAAKDAEEMEKDHDAYIEENARKSKKDNKDDKEDK